MLAIFATARAAPAPGAPGPDPQPVPVLEIRGAIGPATARYVVKGIETAHRSGARVVVLQIDTPGGLGLYDHAVHHCPFCGTPTGSAAERKAKAKD